MKKFSEYKADDPNLQVVGNASAGFAFDILEGVVVDAWGKTRVNPGDEVSDPTERGWRTIRRDGRRIGFVQSLRTSSLGRASAS